jgi:hypothetical protein
MLQQCTASEPCGASSKRCQKLTGRFGLDHEGTATATRKPDLLFIFRAPCGRRMAAMRCWRVAHLGLRRWHDGRKLQLIASDPGEPSLQVPYELMGRHVIGVGVPVLEMVAEVGHRSLISSFRTNLTITRLDLSEHPVHIAAIWPSHTSQKASSPEPSSTAGDSRLRAPMSPPSLPLSQANPLNSNMVVAGLSLGVVAPLIGLHQM